MDPEALTTTQRTEVRAAMLEEYYPGRSDQSKIKAAQKHQVIFIQMSENIRKLNCFQV